MIEESKGEAVLNNPLTGLNEDFSRSTQVIASNCMRNHSAVESHTPKCDLFGPLNPKILSKEKAILNFPLRNLKNLKLEIL